MRRFALNVLILAAASLSCGPAAAWRIYPPDDRPDDLIVELEKAFAEIVPFQSLPAPFDAALRDVRTAERLSYRWRYSTRAQGRASLVVDGQGRGQARFAFAARDPLDGLRYGAAMVLMGGDGRPLHTFYARADVLEPAAGQRFLEHEVRLTLAREPAWWRDVAAIAFFSMTYHPLQKLDDQETWGAMRRAVWHLTKGQGTEQRG